MEWDEEGKATTAWVGRELMRSPSVGVCWVGSHGPTSLPQFGCRFIVCLHTGRAAFWTITHLSAINSPPKCGVLGPKPWVMVIGGKCLWGNFYGALGVIKQIYLLKISQQRFPSTVFECLILKYSWSLHWLQFKISTRWVVPGLLTSMVAFGFVSKFPL